VCRQLAVAPPSHGVLLAERAIHGALENTESATLIANRFHNPRPSYTSAFSKKLDNERLDSLSCIDIQEL
jgi:hypothetical protein